VEFQNGDTVTAKPRSSKRRRKQAMIQVPAFMSDDNHFEWDVRACHDDDMALQLLSQYNGMFKNNEIFDKQKTSLFIVKRDQTVNADAPCLFSNNDVKITLHLSTR